MIAVSGLRAVAIGGLIVLLVMAATAYAFTQSGRETLEPFEVVVVNDSRGTLQLSMCQFGDCGDARETVTLEAGHEMRVPSLTDYNPRPWKIVAADGRIIGCLPFFFSSYPPDEHLVVPVSRAVACGDDFGASSVTGPDWPAQN